MVTLAVALGFCALKHEDTSTMLPCGQRCPLPKVVREDRHGSNIAMLDQLSRNSRLLGSVKEPASNASGFFSAERAREH